MNTYTEAYVASNNGWCYTGRLIIFQLMTAKKPVYNGTHSKCFPAAEYFTQKQDVTFPLIYDKYHHCICKNNKEKKETHRSVSLQVLWSDKESCGVAGLHQAEQHLAETQQHFPGTLLPAPQPMPAAWQSSVSPDGQQPTWWASPHATSPPRSISPACVF